ncbi:rab effector MyRIP [Suncus etruscus]|uniref:rab effector MyRIP n=1 Tax=Suncus etruscus TaxID=109475 RepID=UPI00210F9BFE|nr:rab effector MyRIP [Suncus etruscus]
MGRKLDLSALTDDETEHVLQVVQRDFNLRKKEEERLSEMKQKLDEEGSKCSILSKHQKFVEHCCMRCCSPFTFLVNTKRRCGDCKFNVCKSCCSYEKQEKVWICCVCQQTKLLRTQSLEWFYNNVKSRFKRFGSAKVLKNLYRKHRLESGACFDILGGTFFDANLENEGSISGSDSTFYRHSEGHSMMDTLAVALRVAEEAIEEAISKAEACGDSLDKQNEASYLRDHKEELTEELATTILQKIIRKQKSKSEQSTNEEPEWSEAPSCSAQVADEGTTAPPGGHRTSTSLWRSQSAFSFPREGIPKAWSPEGACQPLQGEQAAGSWMSTDGLDSTGPAAVLQSPDGNWVALPGAATPPSRPLAQPKSAAFQALEEAAGAASAYEEMGSDSEEDFDWSEALNTMCPQPWGHLGSPGLLPTQAPGSGRGLPAAAAASSGLSSAQDALCSDSGASSAGSARDARRRARLPWLQRKAPRHPVAERVRLQGRLDVNFNPQAASRETSDSSEPEETPHAAERRARRWRRARGDSEELSKELKSHEIQPPSIGGEEGEVSRTLEREDSMCILAGECGDVCSVFKRFLSCPCWYLRAKGRVSAACASSRSHNGPLVRLATQLCAQRQGCNFQQREPPAKELPFALFRLGPPSEAAVRTHVPDDLSETDISNETLRPHPDTTEEQRRNRLYELAMKMSEKETSSGEEQESELQTESETRKASLPTEDNCQRVQEQLKKGKKEALAVHSELQLLSTVLKQKYSAVSLCNISTEVLKVINATEELIAESSGPWECPAIPPEKEKGTFPLGTDQVRLDKQLTSLEENVYLAAGTVYGLEGQLNELEDAARCIHSGTDETELAHLEDQVATAAAQVHHAELQISDIESRISALTIAGLNIAPCGRLTRRRDQKQRNQVQTIDTSRQQRRKLPAPPVKAEDSKASSVTTIKTFNRNFILQGSSTSRAQERKTNTADLLDSSLESAVMY